MLNPGLSSFRASALQTALLEPCVEILGRVKKADGAEGVLRSRFGVPQQPLVGKVQCEFVSEWDSRRRLRRPRAQRSRQRSPDGIVVQTCDLDDLIRMKEAAGRLKDRIELEVLAAAREERERE
jgi:hypothetical protein